MKNEKLEIIKSTEFQNLFDKSKKLIDSARNNMGQMANAICFMQYKDGLFQRERESFSKD